MADVDIPSSPPSNLDTDMIQNDDAEMEGTQANGTSHNLKQSSSALDHEYTQPEPETQPTVSASHQNRKDMTLREFLSKMDDYAPIVGGATFQPFAGNAVP